MKFADLPTQQSIHKKLAQIVDSERIPHAILFSGNEGSANLALAIATAGMIICEKPTKEDSCGECPACTQVKQLTHPDLFFSYPYIKFDSAKDKDKLSSDFADVWRNMLVNNPFPTTADWQQALGGEKKQINLYVNEIRNIAGRLSMKPYKAKKKIMIIWLPEYMGKEGNSLLKLIEEPNDHSLFFLVTENPNQILTTILSRTQIIRMGSCDHEKIAEYLVKHKEIEPSEAESFALMSQGNISKAIKLADEVEEPLLGKYTDWMRVCYQKSNSGLVHWVEDIQKSGKETCINLLHYGMHMMRLVMHESLNKEIRKIPEKEKEFVTKFAKVFNQKLIREVYQLLNESAYQIERNGNIKLIFMNLSFQIRNQMVRG
jgi:DNA polymerase III subunit delta'